MNETLIKTLVVLERMKVNIDLLITVLKQQEDEKE